MTTDEGPGRLRLVYEHRGNQYRTVSPVVDHWTTQDGVLHAFIGDDREVVLSPQTEWCIEPEGWDYE